MADTPDKKEHDDVRETMIEAVSDFRKATFEFARGLDPGDHARLMVAQKRIFETFEVARRAPAIGAVPELPPSWEARLIAKFGRIPVGGHVDREAAMQAEIADLCAKLAAKSQGEATVTNYGTPARKSAGAQPADLVSELLAAADATVERWHSRDWKAPHTRDFIDRLAAAVGALKFAPAQSGAQPQEGERN